MNAQKLSKPLLEDFQANGALLGALLNRAQTAPNEALRRHWLHLVARIGQASGDLANILVRAELLRRIEPRYQVDLALEPLRRPTLLEEVPRKFAKTTSGGFSNDNSRLGSSPAPQGRSQLQRPLWLATCAPCADASRRSGLPCPSSLRRSG